MAEERAKKLALNKKKVAEAKAAFAVEQAKLAEKLVLTVAIISDSFNKNDEDNQFTTKVNALSSGTFQRRSAEFKIL